MKVKTISRNEAEFTRERKVDLVRMQRNVDPAQHPFEKPREYTRALNAVKMDKIFARPFVAALNGHSDSVFSLCRHPDSLTHIFSGSCDGELKVWNLATHACLATLPAHRGFVRGVALGHGNSSVITVGDDKAIKLWPISLDGLRNGLPEDIQPLTTFLGEHAFSGISHKANQPIFATSGPVILLWDETRGSPTATFEWGCDSVNAVKFNPIDQDVLASLASDRSLAFHDVRASTPIRKVIMTMRGNAVAWNPMEAFNLSVASEDHNVYTFDMRRLDTALNVHQDHVAAVLDIDYSPTGEEFVTGSYDRTLRIFRRSEGRSREVYHTKRMQRIFCVRFTGDSRFVMSASDDTNIRLWKANAADPLKVLVPREKKKMEYQEKLKARYRHLPEIRRIDRHRHLPKAVHGATRLKSVMKKAEQRKEKNRAAHSSQDTRPVPERKRHIVEVQQ